MELRKAALPTLVAALSGCASSPAIGQPTTEMAWETIAPLPLAVRAPAAAANGDRIYVVAGMSAQGRTGRLQILDVGSGVWTAGASLPMPTDWGAAVWVDERLHFLGGVTDDEAASRQHWVYDAEGDAWSAAPPMPIPAAGAAVAATDGRIFVLGGIEGPAAHSDNVLIHDPATGGWSMGRAVPTPRINWSGAFAAGHIFAAGGGTPGLATTDELVAYDPVGDTWSALAPLPLPREAHGAAATDQWFCVAGGRMAAAGNFNAPYGDAYCYGTRSGAWADLPPLPRARQELVLAVAGGALYALGGRDADGRPMADATRLRMGRLMASRGR